VHNLVHRELLLVKDGVASSRRAPGEETTEFLASTDHWFRPAQARTGPDGALYVVDMYRFLIEHPRWIPAARLAQRGAVQPGQLQILEPHLAVGWIDEPVDAADEGGLARPRRADQAHHLADSLRPLEEQLEHLLDDLNASLRPRIEKPVRERPLMALGIAAGVGVLVGLLLASGRRSA
jgi:ElaB/YqjD/DUF883 family membrane-anchored ribosome-binding protein